MLPVGLSMPTAGKSLFTTSKAKAFVIIVQLFYSRSEFDQL